MKEKLNHRVHREQIRLNSYKKNNCMSDSLCTLRSLNIK